MDKKKILEEGLLERYLLGELPADEHALIENTLQSDPDLRGTYKQLEEDFEKLAFENAIVPPEHIKTALKKTLDAENTVKKEYTNGKKSSFPIGLSVAAGLALLFALSSFWFYNRWETTSQNLRILQQQTANLQNRLRSIEKNYEETDSRYRTISDPDVIPLLLEGNQALPNSRAVAYLNHTTKEAFVSPQGLPELETTETYQMWADVNGEMINMGIVPTDIELVSLKYIDEAESLNLTIEPQGGSDHATVENLVSNVIL